jgi:magnesium transporter
VTARLLVRHGDRVREHDPKELSTLRGAGAWLDVCAPTDAEIALIAEELDLHPIAVEHVKEHHERPKADAYPTYYVISFSAIEASAEPATCRTEIFTIFAFADVLVTVRAGDWTARADVERRWLAGRIPSAPMLLHALLDATVDEYFPVVDDYGERADVLESRILQGETEALKTSLADLFLLKRDLLHVRKLIAPEREVLQVLSRGDVAAFDADVRVYFQDVYDHVVRVTDEIDTLRDLVSNVVDANLAAVSNRLNEVMKVLTSVATILLVMTLVTGFFGQNFVNYIPYDSAAVFWASIVFMLASGGALTVYFRRKGWL